MDADMLVFRACSSVEQEINWGDGLWTLHANENEANIKVDEAVESLTNKVLNVLKYEGEYAILMCFSDKDNFRKHILPTYKANRVGKRKPVCYYGTKAWVEDKYECRQKPNLEADDVMGILSTKLENAIIVSGDKDFKTIPGKFYDFSRDTLYDLSETEADYWHLYQTLLGDTTDGYTGCPGIGAVTAKKLLDAECSWHTVLQAFEKKGLSIKEAIVQAQVARILRCEDYDTNKGEPILWTPIVS